jgi:hypothetical protein
LFEFASQLAHVNAEVLVLIDAVGAPDLFEKLAVSHDFTGVADEDLQQSILRRCEVDRGVLESDLAASQIDDQIADAKDAIHSRSGSLYGMAQGDSQAGEEFADSERLGQIVIGARVERSHFVRFPPTS